MSISSATDRLSTLRRVERAHLGGGLFLAIGLITLVVAIAVSSTTPTDGRLTAGPRPIDAPRSRAMTGLIGAPDLSVPSGKFRDPVTHAVLTVDTPATRSQAPQPTSAPSPSVPGGTFRDPASHALLAVGTRAAPQAEAGPGHR